MHSHSDEQQSPAQEEVIPSSIEHYLEAQLRQYFAAHDGTLPAPGLYERVLARMERPLIEQTLRATRGNQLKAASILGLNRNTLRKKMLALGLAAHSPRRKAWPHE